MQDAVVLVTKMGLGATQPEESAFGVEMLEKFFHPLESQPHRPKAVYFYTEGVRAVAKGSPLEVGLKLLVAMGVRLVVCQTCVKHYGLENQIAVGDIGTMMEIVSLMSEAAKVITI